MKVNSSTIYVDFLAGTDIGNAIDESINAIDIHEKQKINLTIVFRFNGTVIVVDKNTKKEFLLEYYHYHCRFEKELIHG